MLVCSFPLPMTQGRLFVTIGYYRLRGYCFHLYDSNTKQYLPNTSFSDVLKLYQFDTELSHLLFSLSAAIEVGLRSRLCDALLIHQDALVLHDPQYFSDKSFIGKISAHYPKKLLALTMFLSGTIMTTMKVKSQFGLLSKSCPSEIFPKPSKT